MTASGDYSTHLHLVIDAPEAESTPLDLLFSSSALSSALTIASSLHDLLKTSSSTSIFTSRWLVATTTAIVAEAASAADRLLVVDEEDVVVMTEEMVAVGEAVVGAEDAAVADLTLTWTALILCSSSGMVRFFPFSLMIVPTCKFTI